MRGFVKSVKMDIERSQCWQPWHEAIGINMLEQDTETVWEDRNRRMAALKARSAPQPPPPDTQTETAFSSEISTSTPQILKETMYYGIDAVDDEVRNRMDLKLYEAAMQADVGVFITALEQILDEKRLTFDQVFDQMSPIGNTYLHIAANVGNGAIVRLIAHHSPTLITKKNFNGDTALHLAARAGRRCSIEMLLKFSKRHLPSVEEEEGQQVHREHFFAKNEKQEGKHCST